MKPYYYAILTVVVMALVQVLFKKNKAPLYIGSLPDSNFFSSYVPNGWFVGRIALYAISTFIMSARIDRGGCKYFVPNHKSWAGDSTGFSFF